MGFVILLTLILLRLPGRTNSQFKLALGSLFVPLFGLSGSGHQLAEKAGHAVLPRQTLATENEKLRQENAELRIRVSQLEALQRENDRLRDLFGWARTNPGKYKLARVIARDPANWWRNIHINLGQRDGLRPDLPVRTPEGLVGRIAEVSETHARVVLLGDPNCRVAVMVVDGRQIVDNGIISGGAGVIDPSLVELTYLSRGSALKAGQAVVTSGFEGSVYPKGIPIGHLVDFRVVDYGYNTEARVKLAANLNQLEEVWVMLK